MMTHLFLIKYAQTRPRSRMEKIITPSDGKSYSIDSTLGSNRIYVLNPLSYLKWGRGVWRKEGHPDVRQLKITRNGNVRIESQGVLQQVLYKEFYDNPNSYPRTGMTVCVSTVHSLHWFLVLF